MIAGLPEVQNPDREVGQTIAEDTQLDCRLSAVLFVPHSFGVWILLSSAHLIYWLQQVTSKDHKKRLEAQDSSALCFIRHISLIKHVDLSALQKRQTRCFAEQIRIAESFGLIKLSQNLAD